MEYEVKSYDMDVYDNSLLSSSKESTPFVKKEIINIVDQNSTNYQTGTITFETASLANCGKYTDYQNAYIAIPMVFTLGGVTAATDFTTVTQTDFALALKGSNYNFVHSYRIEYDNQQVVSNYDFANALIEFNLHSESSLDDEELNGETIGYVKNKSTGWGYANAASENGLGLYNNNNMDTADGLLSTGEVNSAMIQRQRKFMNTTTSGRELVRGTADVKTTGKNYIENTATRKNYYYNCIIRLKDLLFTQNLPLLKGAMLKIVLQMNIGTFEFSRTAAVAAVAAQVGPPAVAAVPASGGKLTLDPASIQMTAGAGTNPLMVASLGYTIRTVDNTSISTTTDLPIQCGSAALPSNTGGERAYKVSFAVVSNHFDTNQFHQERQCRLYVPVYTLYSEFELNYLNQGTKRMMYKGVQYKGILNQTTNSFSETLTAGIVNPTRLVIVPVLNRAGNEQIPTCLSPFTCEPTYCSPYIIQNFNCQVAGVSIYSQSARYDYEQFLNEMDGRDSTTHNLSRGITAGRISLTDYQNTYGYLVVDLKRRLPSQNNEKVSVGISGDVKSPKPLDFHCFIEYEKEIAFDLATGRIISV
jgi:hypothetical protein